MIVALSYFIAFVTVMIVTTIAPALLIIFKPLVSRATFFAPVANFIVTSAGSFVAVFAYVKISQSTSLALSYFMLVWPMVLIYFNHIRRVKWAKTGASGTKQIMENNAEDYDQKADIRMEQSAEYGHVVGSLSGIALFIGSAPLFF